MKTKALGMCLLLAAFTVTGCGHDLNETDVEMAHETEIPSQSESSITENETEIT